jgi:hypothetical protein
VDCVSVDSFVSKNLLDSESIVLWIDVEGASREVLEGCKKTLDKVSAILIEVEEKEYWNNQWLEKDVRKFLTENNFILVARDGEYEYQYNQIYIKNDIKPDHPA